MKVDYLTFDTKTKAVFSQPLLVKNRSWFSRYRAVIALLLILVCVAVLIRIQRRYAVTVLFTNEGLKGINSMGFNYLANGTFHVNQVLLTHPDGTVYSGSTVAESDIDVRNQAITNKYAWGTTKISYASKRNRLEILITTQNTSSDTIQGLWYQLFTMRFPNAVKEYDGSIPLLAHNVGGGEGLVPAECRGHCRRGSAKAADGRFALGR